ncbi:hypothetical protein ScalyP_jg2585 [Parmales sp. scaly parma]|nr:hypothetical protein ScalyP_jg2585 [Parmales sp. scaly parma]
MPLPPSVVYGDKNTSLKSLVMAEEGVYCLPTSRLKEMFGNNDNFEPSQGILSNNTNINSNSLIPVSDAKPTTITFSDTSVSLKSLTGTLLSTTLLENKTLSTPPPLLALQKNAKPLTPNQKEFFAACGGSSPKSVDIIIRLLAEDSALVNLVHPTHGGTPLHVVSGCGNYEAAKLLCSAFPMEDPDDPKMKMDFLNSASFNGATPLHWACGSGSLKIVHLLLSLGASSTSTTYTWTRETFGKASGQTAAFWAAESGHYDCVAAILEMRPMAAAEVDERGNSVAVVAEKNLKFDVKERLDQYVEGSGVSYVRIKNDVVVHKIF